MSLVTLTVEFMFIVLALYLMYRFIERKEHGNLILFVSAVVYGLLLELTTVRLTGGYQYTGFLLMMGTVPYSIGFMWGILIYATMRTTDLLGLPEHIRPVADAVLVGAVDLTMDPVGVKLGLWQWDIPGHWFGIPLANYFGWFNAVFIFSMIWRGSTYHARKWEGIISKRKLASIQAATSVILATVVLSISLLVYYLNLSLSLQAMLLAAMFLGGSALIAIYLPKLQTHHSPLPHLVVPVFLIFLVFLWAVFYLGGLGIIFLAIYMIIFFTSMIVRIVPFWDGIFGKQEAGKASEFHGNEG